MGSIREEHNVSSSIRRFAARAFHARSGIDGGSRDSGVRGPDFGSRIGQSKAGSNPVQARQEALNKIDGIPLYFEANRGQVDPTVRYLARSGRYSLFLTDDAAVFSLIGGEFHKGPMPAGFPYKSGGETNLTESAVRVRLVGANQHPQVDGLEPLPGRVNYLIGDDKRNWHRDVPTFGRVRFHDVYPGVDLVYYGTPGKLEYDLIAAPGADTSKIKFAIEGPAKTTQTAAGDLVIQTGSGVIRIGQPQNYQQNADGSRAPVAGSFTLAKDGTVVAGVPTRQVGFQIASYDRSRTLYIDPVVKTIPYSTYFGGNGSSVGPLNLEQFASFLGNATLDDSETGVDVALDPSGNAYITGTAYSNNLPTAGFFQSTLNGANSPPSQNPNVFVAKFDTSLSGNASLIYATYIGANGNTKAGGARQGRRRPRLRHRGRRRRRRLRSRTDLLGSERRCTRGSFSRHRKLRSVGTDEYRIELCHQPGLRDRTARRGNSPPILVLHPGRARMPPPRASRWFPDVRPTATRTSSDRRRARLAARWRATGPDGFVVTARCRAEPARAPVQGGLSNAFIMRVGGSGAASHADLFELLRRHQQRIARATSASASRSSRPPQVAITGACVLEQHPDYRPILRSRASWAAPAPAWRSSRFQSRRSRRADLRQLPWRFGERRISVPRHPILAIGDVGTGIVLDGSDFWVAGLTASTTFPSWHNRRQHLNPPFQSTNHAEVTSGPPATTGFITELTPSGTSGLGQIDYSTYFGGTGFSLDWRFGGLGIGDAIGAMAEHNGIVYVTGLTTSASALETADRPARSRPAPTIAR